MYIFQDSHCILKLGVNLLCFLIFVPPMYKQHIETDFNFGGTTQILRVKNPLQRVHGNDVFVLILGN